MVDVRPVRVQFGCGEEARQVAGQADDLPSNLGSGRVRRGARSEKAVESVLEKVKRSKAPTTEWQSGWWDAVLFTE